MYAVKVERFRNIVKVHRVEQIDKDIIERIQIKENDKIIDIIENRLHQYDNLRDFVQITSSIYEMRLEDYKNELPYVLPTGHGFGDIWDITIDSEGAIVSNYLTIMNDDGQDVCDIHFDLHLKIVDGTVRHIEIHPVNYINLFNECKDCIVSLVTKELINNCVFKPEHNNNTVKEETILCFTL